MMPRWAKALTHIGWFAVAAPMIGAFVFSVGKYMTASDLSLIAALGSSFLGALFSLLFLFPAGLAMGIVSALVALWSWKAATGVVLALAFAVSAYLLPTSDPFFGESLGVFVVTAILVSALTVLFMKANWGWPVSTRAEL